MDEPSILARVFDLTGGKRKTKPAGDHNHAEVDHHGPSHDESHNDKHSDHGAKAQSHGDGHLGAKAEEQSHDGNDGAAQSHGDKHDGAAQSHGNDADIDIVIGGGKDPYFMRGGSSLNILSMFQKLGILFFIVFATIALATFIITRPIIYQKLFNSEDDEDYNFDSPDASHSTRLKKIAKILFYYHILIFLCFLLVLLIIFVVVVIYIKAFKSKEGLRPVALFKEFMFTFNNGDGEMISVSDFYLALIIIMVVGYMFYLFYFKYVLSYFTTISYPSYIDPEVSEEEEFENPKKFLLMYGLMIMYILAFAIMVMNYVYGFPSKVYFIWNVIFLFLAMLFLGMIYKETFQRDKMRQLIWFVAFAVLVLLNENLGTIFKTIVETLINLYKRTRS